MKRGIVWVMMVDRRSFTDSWVALGKQALSYK